MSSGIEPGTVCALGETALIDAAGSGDVASVKALIAAGANVNWEYRSGQTVLSTAISSGHADCAAILRAAGASD
jgi:ankyrin repeat protein